MKGFKMIRLSALNIKEIERKGHWKYSDPEIAGVETSSLRIEKGYILICKAYPLSDCIIRTHAEDQLY